MELMMRILAAESSVDMNKLRGSRQMEDRDWTDVAVAYNPVSNAPAVHRRLAQPHHARRSAPRRCA